MQAQLTNQTDLLSLQALSQNVSFSNVSDSKPKEISEDSGIEKKSSFEQAIEKAKKDEEKTVQPEEKAEKSELDEKIEETVSKKDVSSKKTELAKTENNAQLEKFVIQEEIPVSQKVVLSEKPVVLKNAKNESGHEKNLKEPGLKKSLSNKKVESKDEFPKIVIMGNSDESSVKKTPDFTVEKEISVSTEVSAGQQDVSLESYELAVAGNFVEEPKMYLDKDKKIQVHDLRTKETSVDEKNQLVSRKTAEEPLKVTQAKFEGNHAELTLDLNQSQNSQTIQNNILSSNNQAAGANGSSFQAMLTNQLQESAGDIVKAGSIVLKDNDIGSIKLVLHPEALGDVKIDLQLNDKVISGKIVVSSQEAYNAFKDSAENLRQSFNESGFETNGFELSMSNGGSSSSNQQGFENHGQRNYSLFDVALSYGEENFDVEFETVNNFEISLKNGVNIVA